MSDDPIERAIKSLDRPAPVPARLERELWEDVVARLDPGRGRSRRSRLRGLWTMPSALTAVAIAAAVVLVIGLIASTTENLTSVDTIDEADDGSEEPTPSPIERPTQVGEGGGGGDGGNGQGVGPGSSSKPGATVDEVDGAVPPVPPSSAPPSKDRELWVSYYGDGAVWRLRVDDGQLEQVPSEEPSDDRFPVWSPDGTRIGYVDATALVTSRHDGSDRRGVLVVEDRQIAWPSWSPDGTRFVVQVDEYGGCIGDRRDCPAEIWVVGADGSNPHQIGVGETPSWTPDGRRVVYTKVDRACSTTVRPHWGYSAAAPMYCHGELRIMDADGTDDRSLGVRGGVPRVSPDGTMLLWERSVNEVDEDDQELGRLDVFVADMNTMVARPVGAPSTMATERWHPSWTPDGQVLYVQAATGSSTGTDDRGTYLVMVDPSGVNPRNLTPAEGTGRHHNVPHVGWRAP